MHQLEQEKLIETLTKIEAILTEQGFPKGSVKISFESLPLEPKLKALRAEASQNSPIKTAKIDCNWGGCNGGPGILCCTF
ncbi:hypothetical protein ACK336_16890 [Aeromonas veronii]